MILLPRTPPVPPTLPAHLGRRGPPGMVFPDHPTHPQIISQIISPPQVLGILPPLSLMAKSAIPVCTLQIHFFVNNYLHQNFILQLPPHLNFITYTSFSSIHIKFSGFQIRKDFKR